MRTDYKWWKGLTGNWLTSVRSEKPEPPDDVCAMLIVSNDFPHAVASCILPLGEMHWHIDNFVPTNEIPMLGQ